MQQQTTNFLTNAVM